MAEGLAERLGEVAIPTLVLTGELDRPDMLALSDRIAQQIPGAKLASIPNAAHAPNLEQPEEFNRLVLEFLR